jgi:hypothetical protein
LSSGTRVSENKSEKYINASEEAYNTQRAEALKCQAGNTIYCSYAELHPLDVALFGVNSAIAPEWTFAMTAYEGVFGSENNSDDAVWVPAAVNDTGLLRGGRSGDTYMTTDYYTTVEDAELKLSLKNPPEYGVEFSIVNSPAITGPQPVRALGSLPSGGIEYIASDPVEVNILRFWELLK